MDRGGWQHAWARRRRAVAVCVCAAWLVGLELGPNLHLALHDALGAHDHGPARPKFRVEALSGRPARAPAEHRHGDVVHAHPPAEQEAPEDAPPPDRDHAAGLAHRDDLFAAAPFVLVTPAPVDPPGVVIQLPAPREAAWRPIVAAAARGPPGPHRV